MNEETLLPALIQELGKIEDWMRETNARKLLDRSDTIRALIRDVFDSEPAHISIKVEVNGYVLALGEKSNRTVIKSKNAMFKALGAKTFRELAQISLKALGGYLTGVQLAKLTTQEQTGPRTLTITKVQSSKVQSTKA